MYPLQKSLIERRDVFLADREILGKKKKPLGGQAELCGLSLENRYWEFLNLQKKTFRKNSMEKYTCGSVICSLPT